MVCLTSRLQTTGATLSFMGGGGLPWRSDFVKITGQFPTFIRNFVLCYFTDTIVVRDGARFK